MLIEPPYKENDVVTMKMVGGDEIVARVIDGSQADHITVTRPLLVLMSEQSLGFMPYIITIEPTTKVKISRSSIISINRSLKGVSDQYILQTTGIKV